MSTAVNFRERMKVEDPFAQRSLRARLIKEDIQGWTTKYRIVLLDTEPDVSFVEDNFFVYQDGPPHRTKHNEERDLTINFWLDKRRKRYLRVPYTRWTKTIENQTVVDIKRALCLE